MLASLSVCAWLTSAAGVPALAPARPTALLEAGPRVSYRAGPLLGLRDALGVHPGTEWRAVHVPLLHGGVLVIAQEFHDDVPIAHGRLALRVTRDGRLRQVIGRALAPATRLPRGAARRGPRHVWWPGATGLVPARTVLDAPARARGLPTARVSIVALDTGEVLASESAVVELGAPAGRSAGPTPRDATLAGDATWTELSGWLENPMTTPTPETLKIELEGAPPLSLATPLVRVVHCEWDPEAEGCAPVEFPLSGDGGQFPADLPEWTDDSAQADPHDPYAAIAALHGTQRFITRLLTWGWDPEVWDIVGCEWQDVPLEECRVVVFTNVQLAGPDGQPTPFNGAVYRRKGKIEMGQGAHADAAYDVEVMVHEFGHHVTAGHGVGEPVDWVDDGARWRADRGALNEGGSDFYASVMGQTPEVYDYFRNLGGLYLGPRARDVSIPFRCPQNVAGEVHMEGRIWASALHTLHEALLESGLAADDAFPAVFLGANAAIFNFPKDQIDLFPDAARVLADEVTLALGEAAGALAREVLQERGLWDCDYVLDLRQEPSVTGDVDPDDPLDARFLILPSHAAGTPPDVVADFPRAPALQHRVTLEGQENTVTLGFTPDRWRTTQTPDEPLDQDGLLVAALVRAGPEPVRFWYDDELERHLHEADFKVLSQELGEGRHELTISGLTPGQPYAIALVSQTASSGEHFLIDELEWRISAEPEPAPATSSDGDPTDASAGDADTDGDGSDSARGTESGAADDGGCGCASQGPPPAAAAAFALALLLVRRRRR